MPQVFISYSPLDRALAQRLEQELITAKFSIIAHDPSNSILKSIRSSDWILCIVTQDWLDSDACQRELNLARELDKQLVSIIQNGVSAISLNNIQSILFDVDEDLTTIAQRVVSAIVPKQSAAELEPVRDEETAWFRDLDSDNFELQPLALDDEDISDDEEETAWFGAHVLGDFEPKLPALDDKDIAPSQPPRAVPASPMLPPQAVGSVIGREISPISSAPAASDVSFTAFYPDAVTPNRTCALVVSAHIADALADVRKVIEPYLEQLGSKPKEGTAANSQAVASNALLTFIPLVAGVMFQPADQVIVWQPPYKTAAFLFSIPAGYPAHEITGSVKVFSGPIKVGEIPVSMHLDSRTDREPLSNIHEKRMEPYRTIFASYSHRDTPVVEYFHEYRKSLGDHLLVDRHELRSGDDWEQRIMQMIDSSDSFQLFWSRNSAASKYCREEWERALARLAQRPNFIQPVYWTRPLDPLPPQTLNSIHFAPVTLPAVTRVQMALASLRRLAGR